MSYYVVLYANEAELLETEAARDYKNTKLKFKKIKEGISNWNLEKIFPKLEIWIKIYFLVSQ